MSELTPLGLGVAALALGRKVLGPTIDQFAKDLRDVYTEWRAANFEKILEKVKRRAGDVSEGEGVHPRVARTILDEGSWIDDDVQQEYLAGLLMASRSEGGHDDSGAYYARIAATLTASQTRLHYAIYSALSGYFPVVPGVIIVPSEGQSIAADSMRLLAVTTSYRDALRILGARPDEFHRLTAAVEGLHRERLIGDFALNPTEDVFSVMPALAGAQLFTRARGVIADNPDAFLYATTVLDAFEPEPPVFTRPSIGAMQRPS